MPSRASKELRTLLLPAGLILAATALSALWSSSTNRTLAHFGAAIAGSSFFLGTPLIASWSLGAEFQQRTVALLLVQPVSRTRVFFEKWLTTVLVAVLLLVVQIASLDNQTFGEDFPPAVRFLWLAGILASAPLFTLLSRSTIGGLTLSGAAAVLLELALSVTMHWAAPPGTRLEILADTVVLNTVRAAYSVLAFGLGWWMFSRLQVARIERGAGAAATGSRALPLLRYRPKGVRRNLFLTELQVHRPTWLVAGGFMAGWLVTLALALSGRLSHDAIDISFGFLLMTYLPVAIVLAGTLSIAEDAALGLHAWRLTWPISIRLQWAIKLAAALFVAAIAVVIVPALMVELALRAGPGAQRGMSPLLRFEMLSLLAGLVALCFWASAVFGHTVRAAVAAGVMLLAFGMSAPLAGRMADRITVFDGVLASIMVRWHLAPEDFTAVMDRNLELGTVLALVMFVAALIQSFRAFRRVQLGRASIAAQMASLLAVMFVTVLAVLVYFEASARLRASAPAVELEALVRRAVHEAPPPRGETITLEGEDLTYVGDDAKRWLSGARIAVTWTGHSPRLRADSYEARVTFAGGRQYRFWVYGPVASGATRR